MRYYFAPMEGITTHIYRKMHHKYFGGVDAYYTPFISPTMHGLYTPREKKDILPENCKGVPTVPQILANNAEYFVELTKALKEYGYEEVNLNLGCPSSRVANKCKGSGFLGETYRLEKFLDAIFDEAVLPISIKTRIGRYEEEEWEELRQMFQWYPLKELIVHPRVQMDFYKAPVHTELFVNTAKDMQLPLCYNGDIYSKEDYEKIVEQVPTLASVMLGRGMLTRPWLLEEIRGEEKGSIMERFWAFHDELFEAYYEELGNNTLYKMKELWIYMGNAYSNVDKELKKIKKAKNDTEYRIAIEQMKEATR